jgi:mRNA interferase RelE/StbE
MSLGKLGEWSVVITNRVEKKIKRLQPKQQRLILQALRELEANPDTQDLSKLKCRPEWRLRIGNWRMLFRIDKKKLVMVALTLKSRGDVYK